MTRIEYTEIIDIINDKVNLYKYIEFAPRIVTAAGSEVVYIYSLGCKFNCFLNSTIVRLKRNVEKGFDFKPSIN